MTYVPTAEDLAYLESILNPEYVAEVVNTVNEESKPLPHLALTDAEYVKNFRGVLGNFLNRESTLSLGEIKIHNEINFILETIGLEELYYASSEYTKLENIAYVKAERVMWGKHYNLAILNRKEKITIAGLINKALEHAYYNTYYA